MTDRTGNQLGNYRLVRLLGRGNFADVYLGTHIHLHTQAAIKVLHGQLADQEVEGFLTEARTIARLRHPHIIQVLDFGVEGTTPFLVMDYAPGGNLRQRYPHGTQLPLDVIISYVKQVAEALQYAHQEKVIHRDIKPENMLLGRNDEILLSDFGIAVLAHSTRSQHVQNTAGTVAYMAPEQIQAHPSPASDQYAMGIVVYEWLSGERPFHGTLTEIAIKHTLAPPPFLREKVPMLSPEIELVVLQALAKDPGLRFASVQVFAQALEEASRATSSPGRTSLAPFSEHLAKDRESLSQLKDQPHNLPTQVTPLIGRERDVANACALLQRTEVRLVILTGTGGIGKTRLGMEVAHCQLDDFADGVCFVPLAPISDPSLVVATIAQALGIKEARVRPLLDLLKTFLQDKHLLLLLDNFEQVVVAAPMLSDLLAACPHLKILVTSRAVLHIQGEHEFPVPPLALPDLARLPESEDLVQYPAVALFLQRALAIKPDLAVTKANMRAIAEICARLDGLPLAIELAAVRTNLLPPQALLRRLEHPLQVLTSGAQDVPARQQTLRNTITWSYHLLDADQQRLFRRLCVFIGGCTLEAIESICEKLDDGVLPVLEGVSSLIDKSLLQQIEQGAEEPRFVMLETIREYGLEVLTESNEMSTTRQAHALYYLTLAEQAESKLGGPQQAMWLGRLEREHDNLRAAMQWSTGDYGNGGSPEIGLRLGGALRRFWQMHGHLNEGQIFLERALSASEGMGVSARAKALIAAGTLASIQNDYDRTETYCRQSLVLFRELGDQPGIALSLYLLSVIPWMKGDTVATRSLTEEALTLFREMGDKERVAWSLSTLGLLDTQEGKYASARALYEESLATHRELGDKRGIAMTLLRLAQLLFVSQGDQALLRSLLEEGLTLFKELDEKEGIANSYALSGQLALSRGDTTTARSQLEESVLLYREIGNRRTLAESLAILARVILAQGEKAAAQAIYEESLAIARELNHMWLIASCLEGWASMVAEQGQFAWAAQLWGSAESLREAIRVPISLAERADYERAVAAARAQLGEKAFAARWREGRTMTPEQAFAAQGEETVPSPTTTVTASPTYPAGLTVREVEVLQLVARGMTNTQIAHELVLSEKTVATHLTHIFNKTNSENRAAAVAFAMRQGLV
ncbi:MAG TPA: protein kinase [Ktedonobacteraceae bacterium]